MYTHPLWVLLGWSTRIIEYSPMNYTPPYHEIEELRWVSDMQVIPNLWTKLKAGNWETFKQLWVVW